MSDELLTTVQAGAALGVPIHMVKKWKQLGLISNRGTRKVNLWALDELMTAEGRRLNPRVGWRGRAMTGPEMRAEVALRAGRSLSVPHSLPYRALAYTCGKCGDLVSPTSIRRDEPRVMRAHACDREYVRERRRTNATVREVERQRSREYYARVQRATQVRAHRSGEIWTGPDLEIATRGDLSAGEAAKMLGRTLAGVMWARKATEIDPRKTSLAGVMRSAR
jgi:hypothetical protein